MTFKPGDLVKCEDATNSGGALIDGNLYTVRGVEWDYVCLDGVDGTWCVGRFYRAAPSPLTALLAAIDRGSWAEVLEARKAFT